MNSVLTKRGMNAKDQMGAKIMKLTQGLNKIHQQ